MRIVYEFNQNMRIRRSNEELRAARAAIIELMYKCDISILRELARRRRISGYSEMSKVELINQLFPVNSSQPTPESVPRDGRFL